MLQWKAQMLQFNEKTELIQKVYIVSIALTFVMCSILFQVYVMKVLDLYDMVQKIRKFKNLRLQVQKL